MTPKSQSINREWPWREMRCSLPIRDLFVSSCACMGYGMSHGGIMSNWGFPLLKWKIVIDVTFWSQIQRPRAKTLYLERIKDHASTTKAILAVRLIGTGPFFSSLRLSFLRPATMSRIPNWLRTPAKQNVLPYNADVKNFEYSEWLLARFGGEREGKGGGMGATGIYCTSDRAWNLFRAKQRSCSRERNTADRRTDQQ